MKRVDGDLYPTSESLTHRLLGSLEIKGDSTFLEPMAGDGHIVRVLESVFPDSAITTNDSNNRNWGSCMDAADPAYWDTLPKHDWIITNPAFSVINDFIPLAWEHATVGLALLLRISAMEPTRDRGDTLARMADHQTRRIIFGQPRPRYRTDTKNSDSVTTAWFVWEKSWSWREKGIHPPFCYEMNWSKNYA